MNQELPPNHQNPDPNQLGQAPGMQEQFDSQASLRTAVLDRISSISSRELGTGSDFSHGAEDIPEPDDEYIDDDVERSRNIAGRVGSAIMRFGGRAVKKLESLNDKDNVIDYLYETSQTAQERQDIRKQRRQDKRDDHAETTEILLDRYLGFKYKNETYKREKKAEKEAHKEDVAEWKRNKKEQGITYRHYVRWIGGIAMDGMGLIGGMASIIAQEQASNLYGVTKEKASETKKKYKTKRDNSPRD